MTKITSEDFDSWRDNAVTQAVFKHLERKELELHEFWRGVLTEGEAPDPNRFALLHAELRAKRTFIRDMLGLELSDIQEEPDARASTVDAGNRS